MQLAFRLDKRPGESHRRWTEKKYKRPVFEVRFLHLKLTWFLETVFLVWFCFTICRRFMVNFLICLLVTDGKKWFFGVGLPWWKEMDAYLPQLSGSIGWETIEMEQFLSKFWDLWVLMAERLALCDLGARAGGSSGFRTVLCCFFYSRISIMAMFVFGTPFFIVSAIPILWMIQCYHPSFSYDVAELASRSLCLVFFVCVWLLFCCFVVFFVWFLRHGEGYLVCVLVLCQFNFCSPPSVKMDTSQRVERPGGSQEALDGKKGLFCKQFVFFSENKTQTQNQT